MSGAPLRMGCSTKESHVERDQEVPHLDGLAEARDRARRACAAIGRSPRSAGSTRSRRTCITRGARSCSRAAQSACRGRRSGPSWRSCASACAIWSGHSGARPMSLRSWETGFGRGSDKARRLRPSARGRGAQPVGAGAHPADLTAGDLPGPDQAAGRGEPLAAAGRRGRTGDRRGRRGQPDRRLPDRDRVGQTQARAGDQPQAGAARHARAQADPAPDAASHAGADPASSRSSGPGSYGIWT